MNADQEMLYCLLIVKMSFLKCLIFKRNFFINAKDEPPDRFRKLIEDIGKLFGDIFSTLIDPTPRGNLHLEWIIHKTHLHVLEEIQKAQSHADLQSSGRSVGTDTTMASTSNDFQQPIRPPDSKFFVRRLFSSKTKSRALVKSEHEESIHMTEEESSK